MPEWERSTTVLSLESIQPEIATAIRKHLESYNLGPVLDDYQVCIETVSSKKKRGLFDLLSGGDKHVVQVAILTPRWLVVGMRGEKPDSAAALSVQLKEAEVMDHEDHPAYKQLPDTGLHITGAFTGRVGMHGSQRITYFLGLGSEPAATEFRSALTQSMQGTRI